MMLCRILQIEFQVTNANLGYTWRRTGNTTVLENLDQFYTQDWKLFEVPHLIHRCGNLLKQLQYQNPYHEDSSPLACTSLYSSVKRRPVVQGWTWWLLCPYFCCSVSAWPPPSSLLVMETASRSTENPPCFSKVPSQPPVREPGSLLLIQYPLHYRRFI